MTIEQLLSLIKQTPDNVEFHDVMQVIEDNYHYSPSTFNNADLVNQAGTNEGSCKIFAFAKQHQLDQSQTLACFGQYYRQDVLQHPERDDHGNIRRFINTGWDGIAFAQHPLSPR